MGTTQIREQTMRKVQDPGDGALLEKPGETISRMVGGHGPWKQWHGWPRLLFPGQEAPGLNSPLRPN